MDQVEQVRERTDIIALINEYAPLKKAGRNFKANCPFHNENTPSFMVSPERQMWHCFGCGKGGDAFTFLMEYEHMDFPEALRFLAKRAGIELTESPRFTAQTSKKETFFKINRFASSFYHYILLSHSAGRNALAYLGIRKLHKGSLETFKVGFAPTTGWALVDYLIKKKHCKPEDIVDAGLGFMRGGRIRDFFAGRIMFPLTDHRDNIVGFSGRVMKDAQSGPKYINTKDTLIYHKGEQFFGIDVAKNALRKTEQAILVEGEFDVISCFQEGISNVLAIKGTALTEAQVRLLSRYVKKVTIGFDDDKAGQDALIRSLSLLESFDLTTTVVKIPNGKDPDEAIKEDPYAFKSAVKNDVPVYDYLLEKKLLEVNPKEAAGKKQLSDLFLPLLAHIQNQVIKEHYLKKVSSALDTSYESLTKEMERHTKPQATAVLSSVVKDKRPREEVLEEYLLALVLQSEKPQEEMADIPPTLVEFLPKERAYQKLFFLLHDFLKDHEKFDTKTFLTSLPSELLPTYNTSMLYPITNLRDNMEEFRKEVKRVSGELLERLLRSNLMLVSLKLEEQGKSGEQSQILAQEYEKILSLLKK